ncbi:uncharacterized protein [Diabrotica undecimpunctata]|uniref:uncharacterized protein n=1 Tax=Diabrotica undecimpunctata TaxID=50387 RepID=UPI003B63FC7F
MHLLFFPFFIGSTLLTICTASDINSQVATQFGLDPHYHPILSLYHSQDKLGHYVYGYATPTVVKSEISDKGVTRGGYSYIDINGQLQTVEYVVDPIHGFRVAATNLPQDDPDVAAAKAQHIAEYAAIKSNNEKLAAATVAYSNPVAVPIGAVPDILLHQELPQPVTDLPAVVRARSEHLAILNAAYASTPVLPVPPRPVQDLPEVIKARAEHLAEVERIKLRNEALARQISVGYVPEIGDGAVVPIKTVINSYVAPAQAVAQTAQYSYNPVAHSDDNNNLGKYSYGYVGPHSSHSESRSEDGVTRGGYSYIDANGILQTVHYIADAEHGFRVAASNIPVDPYHAKRAVYKR